MLFDSLAFLIFFPVVTILFFILPFRFRWFLLLVASCFFYMFFKPVYILILAFTIVIDYFAGISIEQEQILQKKKLYLALSITANIGVLALFKYYNFFNENITHLFAFFHIRVHIPLLRLLLPIGLSFHTFQAIAYNIEIYRGNQKAERHFGIYALYVLFYPQLVAGPIERPQNLIHQFYARQRFNYDNALLGMNLMVYGLFKKLVVADRLSEYVDHVYAHIGMSNTISITIACFFYSIQIYCDFSGYSDIARGAAKFMGFDLMVNFNRPYMATSIRDFWSRWHISLSTWFRDYLYIPLGGSRAGKWKLYRNLFIVFLISGLWHGARWNFVIWGVIHFLYILASSIINYRGGEKPGKMYQFISQVTVFCLVTFAWIFFRAENIAQAITLIRRFLKFDCSINLTQLCADRGLANFGLSFFAIGLLGLSYLLPANLKMKNSLLFLFVTIFVILIIGKNGNGQFIYYQF